MVWTKEEMAIYDKIRREKTKINREKNKKKIKIRGWIQQKIISNDWDATYEWVMNTKNCEDCCVLLENGVGNNGKCLDHDHSINDRPNIRAVLCFYCNKMEGVRKFADKEARKKYWTEMIKCKKCGTLMLRSPHPIPRGPG